MHDDTRQGVGFQVVIVALLVALPLAVAAPLLTAESYGALATAIQSVVVTVALLVALLTYRADSRDRRVDRVLALHQEFFDSGFQDARTRLVEKLRSGSALHKELTRDRLTDEEYVARVRVLRYFERVYSAHLSASLENRLAASLLGSHAAWWDLALELDAKASRQPLHSFAAWSNQYAEEHHDDALFARWGITRKHEFGRTSRE